MKKYASVRYASWLLLLWLCFVTACNNGDDSPVVTPPVDPVNPEKPVTPDDPEEPQDDELQVEWKLLKEFTFAEIKAAGTALGLPSWAGSLGGSASYEGDIQLRVMKVTCKSNNPNGSGEKITLSGVLLLPPAIDSSTVHRQVLALPYTYILDKQSPTNQMTNYDASKLEAYMVFWMMQASKGYVVMIPDYPGFGDSFGQCFIPYVEKESMVRTTLDFLHASQTVLRENHYAKKDNFLVSGYSLGAFVATQTVRELETNPVDDFTVDLLFAGGTPCSIKQISDMVRATDELPTPYLLPFAICGYKENSYQNLDVQEILKEPYASNLLVYFDGKSENYDEIFPRKTSDLFTEQFINNTNNENAQIDKILEDNSLKTWTNKCNFILVHGKSDETVYYENAKNYADEHNAAGGKVTFLTVDGNHTKAGIPYFVTLLLYLPIYK